MNTIQKSKLKENMARRRAIKEKKRGAPTWALLYEAVQILFEELSTYQSVIEDFNQYPEEVLSHLQSDMDFVNSFARLREDTNIYAQQLAELVKKFNPINDKVTTENYFTTMGYFTEIDTIGDDMNTTLTGLYATIMISIHEAVNKVNETKGFTND